MECYPVSSRPNTIHLEAAPFNITILQSYAATASYEEENIEDFYSQLQEVVDVHFSGTG